MRERKKEEEIKERKGLYEDEGENEDREIEKNV